MGQILAWIVCGGVGFWLGSHRLIPLWAIIVLVFLGAGLWCVGEWMERREGHGDDEG